MTISLFTGTPGSGKSLHLASIIYWHLRAGKPVIANFEINREAVRNGTERFAYVDNSALSPRLLQDFAIRYWDGKPVKEGELTLIIDECGVLFSPRDWNASDRRDWIKFFSQHRKLGYTVYLVAQFDGMVDKQIRALVEYEIKHRKVNNHGWVGTLFGMVAFGRPVIAAVTYWYGVKKKISAEWTIGLRRYYRIYDTMKIFD